MRMIILSHGHPELSAGGAERAAYSLFQRLKQDPQVDEVVFVARAEHQAIGHSAFLGSFRGASDPRRSACDVRSNYSAAEGRTLGLRRASAQP